MVPAKAIVAAAFVAGAGGTSVYFLQPKENTMPAWHSLKKDSGSETAYGDGKYAHKYLRYLVGDKTENNDWWNWSFRNNYKDAKEGFESGITDGTKLKEACKKAYLAGTSVDVGTKTVSLTESGTTTKYKEEEIWKFCSPLGAKPKTVAENNDDYTNKKGNDTNNKTKFVSTKNEDRANILFWEIRNKEFYGTDNFEKITVASGDSTFHTEQAKATGGKTIKTICAEAYDTATTGSDSSSPSVEIIVKYCAIEVS